MNKKIGPINAATVTPLTADGDLDVHSAKNLVRRWIDIGLDGAFILGSMGEGRYLTDQNRDTFIEVCMEEAQGQVVIFASAIDSSRQRMLERAKRCASFGVDYVILGLPDGATPAAVQDVLAVAEACPVPCGYYEVPAATGRPLMISQVLEIAAHDNISLIKDSSKDALLAQALTSPDLKPADIAVLDGVEYHTAYSAALGYDGVLHGGGALTGKWVRTIWEAVKAGDLDEALALDRAKALFLSAVYNRYSPGPLQTAVGQKHALKILGVLDSDMTAGDQVLNDTDRARIRKAVDAHRNLL